MEIFDYLPQVYKQGDSKQIVESLTNEYVQLITSVLLKLEDYNAKYLDPATCSEEWLDDIAVWCAWGKLWDKGLPLNIKRNLLLKSNDLWENRGNRKSILLILEAFSIEGKITNSTGFIAGVSFLPATLTEDPFDLTIILINSSITNNAQLQLFIKHFIPCWVTISFA